MKNKTTKKTAARTKERWIQIGKLGVDSGQLMICDPCYVDSQWIRDQDPAGHPPVVLSQKGRAQFPALTAFRAKFPFAWGSFDDVCPELGMSINDARDQGLVVEVDMDPVNEFSYRGCCDAAVHNPKDGAGQLNYKAGHAGVAVAFSSGYGDGCYPVMARINSEGRVVEVRVIMG